MVNNIYRTLSKSVVSIFGQEGIKTAQLVADMTARKHAQLAASPAPSSQGTSDLGGTRAAAPAAAVEPPAIPLLRSKDSFKVLTECPLIVMLLFQLYPKYIKANIPDLIPLMIEALRLQSQLPRAVDGVLPACLRGRYKEMIACQVIARVVGVKVRVCHKIWNRYQFSMGFLRKRGVFTRESLKKLTIRAFHPRR